MAAYAISFWEKVPDAIRQDCSDILYSTYGDLIFSTYRKKDDECSRLSLENEALKQ